MFYFFYDYFKNKYFDELKNLPAETREAMIFKRTCEEIPISIKKDDLIAGRYGCENSKNYAVADNKDFLFIDAYSKEEREIKNYLEEKFGINIRFDKGHTCIDYRNIITTGLKSYEEKVKNELQKTA